AAHLAVLPSAGSDAVAGRLHRAGVEALARGAAGTAARRLRRALEEGAARPSRVELLFELGRAEAAERDPECVPHLQEALTLAEGVLQARVACVLTEVLAGAAAWEALRQVLEVVLA